MRVVMALSGGMDSTGLLIKLLAEGCRVSCISYEYGQKHNIELQRAAQNITYLRENKYDIEHKIVDLSSAMKLFDSALINHDNEAPEGHYEEEQMKATVVPNRNAIFASILYGYALSISQRENCEVKIALGVHSGDHTIYPDCRPEFYVAINEAFTIGNWNSEKISFHLPYIEGDKKTILLDSIKSCKKLNLEFDTIFANTSTSYNPDLEGRSSGRSGADIERILAFYAIGRKDPVEYVKPWKEILADALQTQLRYQVTRQNGTERAFTGEYDNHFENGNYKCFNCGVTLFDSKMKYNSGCGWPAFHSEHEKANIERIDDKTNGMLRTEVRCSSCDSHLGHVFNDGPKKFGGERYCINSICLEFKEELI